MVGFMEQDSEQTSNGYRRERTHLLVPRWPDLGAEIRPFCALSCIRALCSTGGGFFLLTKKKGDIFVGFGWCVCVLGFIFFGFKSRNVVRRRSNRGIVG